MKLFPQRPHLGFACASLLLIALAHWLVLHRETKAAENPVLVLVKAKVYRTPFTPPVDDAIVVIRNGTIASVGPRSITGVPANARVIDCANMTIVAGFQNSHIHFAGANWSDPAHIPAQALAAQLVQMLTRYGFTTAIDLGSPLKDTLMLRQRVESGEVPGPRILTAGQPLFPQDGIPFQLAASLPPSKLQLLKHPGTSKEAIQDVRQNIAEGADFIKLFTGSSDSGDPAHLMRAGIAAAAVTEAHREHKLSFAHPGNLAGFEIALSAHVDVFAHSTRIPKSICGRYIERMKQADIALVPTLNLYRSDPALSDFLNEVEKYSRRGGLILFGTDAGDQNQYDPSSEYALMQRAGLNWSEILASLTIAPAQKLNESQVRGQIAPGMKADIVVLGADPAVDVSAFSKVQYTIRNGIIIYQRQSSRL